MEHNILYIVNICKQSKHIPNIYKRRLYKIFMKMKLSLIRIENLILKLYYNNG